MIIKNAIRCNICVDEIESNIATIMCNASVVLALSMEATIICVGVLKTRAVSPTYP